MQCFVLNLRRPQFQDRRVRQAFNLAFDFEWANKNLFFGQYARVGSYFEGTELAAPKALPQGRELEILNEIKDQVPPEVFTTVHANPINASPDDFRNNLRKAVALLKEAGYEIKDGKLVNAKTGEPLKVEFLLVSPLFERIVQPISPIFSGSVFRRASAWSTAPNIRGGSTASTTTSSSAISGSRTRRATSSAIAIRSLARQRMPNYQLLSEPELARN